jgi:hypothetical protein
MNFKYYHGTSDIFLDSILEFGLGGINPNFKYKNLELLRFLFNECEKTKLSKQEYLIGRENIVGMVNQTTVEFIMPNGKTVLTNYKHDKPYVGITRERALIYACDNNYGSEILEYCIMLFKFLKEENIDFELPEKLNLFGIEKYIDKEHKPILIELTGIKDSELETEFGENGSDFLSDLRHSFKTLNPKEIDIKMAYSNFKLLKPIFTNRMKIYEIEFEGKIGRPDFDFTLSLIKTA